MRDIENGGDWPGADFMMGRLFATLLFGVCCAVVGLGVGEHRGREAARAECKPDECPDDGDCTPQESHERLELMLFGIKSMRDLILKLPPTLYSPEEIAFRMDEFMRVVREGETNEVPSMTVKVGAGTTALDGHCTIAEGRCNCGGDTAQVRAGCSNWKLHNV